jgi:hypothetical protein
MLVLPIARARYRSPLQDAMQTMALAGLLMMLMSIPLYIAVVAWAGDRQMQAAWTIKGPPCPIVARPDRMVVGSKPAKAFDYGGVGFARHFGHASCVAWREGGLASREITRVCQFNAPGAVTIALPGRTISYQPGIARRATVSIRHGQATCVRAGSFTT